MKSSAIRQSFLDFFASKGHTVVPSSSLVPGNDPTLLFTNAGMVQFKDVFTGQDTRPYSRAVSSQRCVRAGGKHNDLENVGYTARHHTFFEMLGNFSFGDYFKQDAIKYAWEYLTTVLKLPSEKLWVTVYAEDDEAYDIWHNDVGVPKARIVRIGDNKGARYASDNFWAMGDTGPCGPCTEIFYDHGPDVAGGPPGSPDEDGDRYIEIWNNVFMQFNRDEAGTMHPLPKPSVDTGMGLERISAVMQHVHSNYEIDLFQALIAAAARETNTHDLGNNSLKVIADHIRACSFLIVDGVIPGNEGRGYVLRRIIRRAIRHGYKLGARAAFFHRIVPDLGIAMGEAYPELVKAQTRVMDILRQEEERFFETIEHGMGILESELKKLVAGGVFDGELAFKLHDTYGFPLDLTADICREAGVAVDTAAFDAAMARQKAQARGAGKFKLGAGLDYAGEATTFHGYDTLAREASVLALYKDGSAVGELKEGDSGVVVLDHTPFYAESGGQVGDRGTLQSKQGAFEVEDTLKIQAQVFGHHGVVKTGSLAVGDSVLARVDETARARTMRNHSVTHLMHKALREVLGEHVQQKGSLVDSEKTRFDFVQPSPMTAAQIREVEARVNAEILVNTPTQARVMGIEDAQKTGAMMLFGEKYGDEVRVLDIGSSRELCGGTHVARTGDIGLFKIVSESGVAAGVRRVEAITGDNALAYLQAREQEIQQAAAALKAHPAELGAKLAQTLDHVRALEKDLERLKSKLAASAGDELVAQAADINGVKVLAARLDGIDAKGLRETADKLRDKLKSCALVLGTVADGKVSLIAAVTPDVTAKIKAGELVNVVAAQVGGKGGGKPDLAMAGGTDPGALPAALASVEAWVQSRLS
ncbi:alanine--tRNA ligase [Thiobacillus denitrificans]|uniref:Alanine--tRNA ligase n=1 Tax=Thiobacillus denitrificans (strain ATCC 25259 / T1) TaxID=292415 RepID=SYA_THIDA|nr:alanine--tRNA ligase [Thiobacillus denitrificans]Q3SLA9.2 RecName: Full=Alanine--tRNA ligase; AltName: Full=Alanyl-tRNA synthetase; Short=AlaRS [Thiobacillus denitrificans ATCC 25259]